jgi:hypothetical protein
MINAINDLRRQWRERQKELGRQQEECLSDDELALLAREHKALDRCCLELVNTVASVRPLPLTEGSTQKLYNWAPRIIAILDLAIQARDAGDEWEGANAAYELGQLADQPFLNDIYDLFKQLANRGTE